jgi:hypothetical protein
MTLQKVTSNVLSNMLVPEKGKKIGNIPLPGKLALISFLILFLLKVFFAFGYCQLIFQTKSDRQIGQISYASGDYKSYIDAMENFIKKGDYYFINQLGDTVKAGRPPHFAIPYLLARQFFNRQIAADFLSIFNILIDCFSILCLSFMPVFYTRRPKFIFVLAMFLGAMSAYVSNWSFITLPDAPAAGLLMIGIFFYWRVYSLRKNSLVNIFFASLFFCWAITLRPYLLFIVLCFAIAFLLQRKYRLKELVKLAIASLIPLIILLGPWTVRNYFVLGKPILFQQDTYAGYSYSAGELSLRKLASAMGEDGSTFWDPTSMSSYFSPDYHVESVFHYPLYIVRDSNLYPRLGAIRRVYLDSFCERTHFEDYALAQRISVLRMTYVKHYPFRYYIVNPILRTAHFFGHSGSYYISVDKRNSFVVRWNKYFQSLLYYLVLIAGTVGLFKLGQKDKIGVILALPLLLLSLMPLIFGFMEPRYALAFYYPGMLGLVIIIDLMANRVGSNEIFSVPRSLRFKSLRGN